MEAWSWAAGRNAWVRLPLWGYGLFVLFRVVNGATTSTPFDLLNLGIHELGHMLFTPLGQTWHMMGGTIAETLVPIVAMFMFRAQRDYFAISFCFCWLAESLLHTSHYLRDAVAQQMQLVSPFAGEPLHDWNYLMNHFQLISHTDRIADGVQGMALVSAGIFVLAGGLLLFRMMVTRRGAPSLHE